MPLITSAVSLEEIFNEHKDKVFNLCLNYLQQVEDAEEVTQDVFVEVHKSLASFKGDAKLSTWIYRITVNKCLDCIKAKQRKKRYAFIISLFSKDDKLIHEPVELNHPGVKLEQQEALKRLFAFINELPPNQKTALLLSKTEHKSQQEIAEIMNLSPKAVESLIQRAKSNLQNKLNSSEG